MVEGNLIKHQNCSMLLSIYHAVVIRKMLETVVTCNEFLVLLVAGKYFSNDHSKKNVLTFK